MLYHCDTKSCSGISWRIPCGSLKLLSSSQVPASAKSVDSCLLHWQWEFKCRIAWEKDSISYLSGSSKTLSFCAAMKKFQEDQACLTSCSLICPLLAPNWGCSSNPRYPKNERKNTLSPSLVYLFSLFLLHRRSKQTYQVMEKSFSSEEFPILNLLLFTQLAVFFLWEKFTQANFLKYG